MGMDLRRREGTEWDGAAEEYFCTNLWGWSSLIRVAKARKWRPRKTKRPLDSEGAWEGGYMSNDGQYVTPTAAAKWADALERALARGDPAAKEDSVLIREFIAYCRGGGFEVW